MNWLSSNWIWLALGVGALALFVFGRGACGMGHGGHDHRRRGEGDRLDPRREAPQALPSTPAARGGADAGASRSTEHVHGAAQTNEAALAAEHAGHAGGPAQAGRQRHRHGC